MAWIKYAGVYVTVIVIAFIITSISTKKNTDEFLGRINSSAMKGIAILAVMLCHFMGTFGGGITLFTPLGGIGVSIFLFLSAYGLNESYTGGVSCWWRKRVIAVFIPYFIVQCILYWPFHEYNFIDFILDVTLIAPQYHNGWYLNYLLICYITFYVIMRVPFLRKHKILVFTTLSIAQFFWLREIKAEQSLSFLTGIVLSEYKESDNLKNHLNWKFGILLMMIGAIALAVKQTDIIRSAPQLIFNSVQLMIKLPCGLGLCLVVISVSKKLNLKIFALIGTISYELYLVHGYVLQRVPVSLTGEVIFITVSVGIAIVLHYVLRVIKKPYQKILRMN